MAGPFFRTADFNIEIQKDLLEPLKKVVEKEGGKSTARMGIRSFHIRVAREKESKNAFQLPIYAVFRTPEGTMLTFELENTFLQVSLEGEAQFGMSDKVWLDFDQDRMLFFEKTVKIAKI